MNRREWSYCSAKREGKHLYARIEKLDLEKSIDNGFGLADQLIQSLFANRTVALFIDVAAVSSAWRLSINEHAKAYRDAGPCRSHDKMEITGVKAVGDAAVGLVQRGSLSFDSPLPSQRSIV